MYKNKHYSMILTIYGLVKLYKCKLFFCLKFQKNLMNPVVKYEVQNQNHFQLKTIKNLQERLSKEL
jgi:hypothetical protein